MVHLPELAKGVWVSDRRLCRSLCYHGLIGVLQAVQSRAQVAIVECIRVHLHEHCHHVQREEDPSRPCPIARERETAPEGDPAKLIERLKHDAAAIPLEHALAVIEQQVQRQAQTCRCDH